MAFGSVTLSPGVNTERTPMLLRASISQSSLIRFKDDLAQKYGGWAKFYPFLVNGVPRDMHGWQDLNNNKHLSVGTTTQLCVITPNPPSVATLQDITPQTLITNPIPNISTTAGSSIVTIVDPNINNITTFDSVFFNVPVAQGGLILDGLYPVTGGSGDSYTIDAGVNATTTEANPTAVNATTAIGNPTLHFASVPTWVVDGQTIYNISHPSSISVGTTVSGTGSGTVTMSANAAAPGVGGTDAIVFSSVPVFTTVSGSAIVSVGLIGNNVQVGQIVVFAISTTANGVTIVGGYKVISTDGTGNNFTIQVNTQASASSSFAMNSGNAQLVYYITLGPPQIGFAYGQGLYGEGVYGFGSSSGSPQTGNKITAVDWTSDNWGEILLACPKNGAIYYWEPNTGFANASVISSGPPFNTGMFISMAQQIVIAYGSSVHQAIGYQQQPMLVQWCDVSNFFNWTPTVADQAGNFVIPNGSQIICGLSVGNQDFIWTDIDLWAMNYIGPPDVYGFNKIGPGMGAASLHAVQVLRGSVFWMASNNFCNYTGSGASVIPCPVWDVVFQNLNTDYIQNVRAMPNTSFNEVGWLYPSNASMSGECDSYVKMNITEQGAPWDYGPMARSAWIDQGILGPPIGASPNGNIYQHETTADADGLPLISSFTTGYFYLAEGEDFVVVDQILPDFKWALFSGGSSAQIQLSFSVVNYPSDTPNVFGPYTVTSATQMISTRARGRLGAFTIASGDIGSFWRLGSIKYRYRSAGRR